jgi:hypothetical protein
MQPITERTSWRAALHAASLGGAVVDCSREDNRRARSAFLRSFRTRTDALRSGSVGRVACGGSTRRCRLTAAASPWLCDAWYPSGEHRSVQTLRFWRWLATGCTFVGDRLLKARDAVSGEGRDLPVIDIADPEMAVLGIHAERQIVQPILLFAEHLSDAANREDVGDTGHGRSSGRLTDRIMRRPPVPW